MKKAFLLATLLLLALAPLAAASITVTLPAGGTSICHNNPFNIHWVKVGTMPASVYIQLRKTDATLVATIAASTPNDGAFSWTVPCSVAPGNYYIRVGTVNPAVIGNGPVIAVKACDGIGVLSPNGGENWQMDTKMNVRWSKIGCWTGTVKLILLQDGKHMGVIASGLPLSGIYAWPVGHTDKGVFRGQGFKVRAMKEYGVFVPIHPIADNSDNAFSIYKLE